MFNIFLYTLLIKADLDFMLCGTETYMNANVKRNGFYICISKYKSQFLSNFGIFYIYILFIIAIVFLILCFKKFAKC